MLQFSCVSYYFCVFHFFTLLEGMEIDQSINDEPNTLDIEPEKEKTPVTNHGDIPPMSIGKLFILLFLSINSLILLIITLFVS